MVRTNDVHLTLRFNESLRAKLEKMARRSHRSLNTEIVHRLVNSLEYEHGFAAGRAAGKAAGARDAERILEAFKQVGVDYTPEEEVRLALSILNDHFNRRRGEQS